MKKIALVGNPNAGKSSVFNALTGLNQHVGNYPGVTVDKHIGYYKISEEEKIEVIDLPGTYSLFPKSNDERIVFEVLGDKSNPNYPDLAVVVADSTNLERNLLLFSQLKDLGIPLILVLNMTDLMLKEGVEINYEKLSELLEGTKVVPMSARNKKGIEKLKEAIESHDFHVEKSFIADSPITKGLASDQLPLADQNQDTEARYKRIRQILQFCVSKKEKQGSRKRLTQNIDRFVVHPVFGYAFFLLVLFLIFQAIYEFASLPMDLIDSVFLVASQYAKESLPAGVFTNLIAEGVIPGIGGIVIFIPQIAFLFAFLALLEETGYMSRVVFIMDKIMRPFGLSGKSVVPLMSGVACAIPAIMATRSIDQWKDRLVTILVVPLTSCSARLPVYAILIALVVPDTQIWGIFNLKGMVLMCMYLLGFIAALLIGWILKMIIRTKQKSFLIMEMPTYKLPRIQNVALLILEKTKLFVWESGKIIMAISVILWVLASYGPTGRIEEAVEKAGITITNEQEAAIRLENSWIGIMGKGIEPVIRPLGYDWQIGIALISSFAAREVFVSSMATIYSVGEDFDDDTTLIERMRSEVNQNTGTLTYNLATGLSLMVFYAFAMQCMSTLAVVKRETKSWKWPIIQFVYMTILAYGSAFITFNIFK